MSNNELQSLRNEVHDSRRYMELLFEQMHDRFDSVLDVIKSIQQDTVKIPIIQSDMTASKLLLEVRTSSLQANQRDISSHEKRISRLEDVVYSSHD